MHVCNHGHLQGLGVLTTDWKRFLTLRKHAYSNLLRILPKTIENFEMKISGSFHISAQNIDCGYLLEPPQRGGSNEYPQSMFLSRYKKNNVYPCKPQFYCIKVEFKGVCFRDDQNVISLVMMISNLAVQSLFPCWFVR